MDEHLVAGDVCTRDVADGFGNASDSAERIDCTGLRVGTLMNTNLASERENDSLSDLMRAMRRKGVLRVQVVCDLLARKE